MKAFFSKGVVLFSLTIIPFLMIQYQICTTSDQFYWSTTHSSSSLIVGLSRERVGINPSILKKELELSQTPQNIAFDAVNSPYGKKYFSFIANKIKVSPHKGIHIIGISPNSIRDYSTEINPERENDNLIFKLYNINIPNNLEYFIRSYSKSSSYLSHGILQFIGQKRNKIEINHQNGWDENLLIGDLRYHNNMRAKFTSTSPSKQREYYFEKTIELLSSSGEVFLVRMPVSKEVKKMETEIYPEFDSWVKNIARRKNIKYLDYSDNINLNYYDFPGHHLVSESANKFTKALTIDIKPSFMLNNKKSLH